MKSPTLFRINELCQVMQVHPLTQLALAYADGEVDEVERLLKLVKKELNDLS